MRAVPEPAVLPEGAITARCLLYSQRWRRRKNVLSDLRMRMQTPVIGQKHVGELSYIVSEFVIHFSRV